MDEPSEIAAALDEVARGHTDAFARVVRAYGLPLRSYLASQVHHLDDVDDLAQEVFLAALKGLAGYRRGDDFGAWLRGIARNKLLNYFRSTSRRTRAMQRFHETVARVIEGDLERASAADRSEAIERLLACIAQLPDRLRRVVRAGLNGAQP